MPHREPDPEDPLALRAVGCPDPEGESTRRMAECLAEEFLRLGFPPGRVLSLFESPRYALPHRAWRALGAEETRRIVERTAALLRPPPAPRQG
jgi:hypothetical protein